MSVECQQSPGHTTRFIEATGVISKSFKQDFEEIPCKISQLEMQKAALLGTIGSVRRFTKIEGC